MQAVIVNPSSQKICGVSLLERHLRALQAHGIHEVVTCELAVRAGLALPPTHKLREGKLLLLIQGDHLFDPRLIEHFAKLQTPTALVAEDHRWAGMAVLDGELLSQFPSEESALGHWLSAHSQQLKAIKSSDIESYVPKLRRTVPLYWLKIKTEADVRRAEKLIVISSEKDPSDLLARYVHRPIENWAVRKLANYPITPNQLSVFINILAYTVTALFLTGNLLAGSLLTLVVGLMDGLDGKLARVKDLTTKVGYLEHSFDLLFELSWILALAFHLSRAQGLLPLILAGAIIILVAFYRDVYARFGQVTHKSLDVYGRFERFFRRVAGRRNLYNIHILAFVLAGVPFYALVSIFMHAAITAAVYSYRALIHLRAGD